jgi:hypothetical protein
MLRLQEKRSDQHAHEIVCVLTGPWKKKRPCVQALKGTVIVINTLWPGARTPRTGLKVTPPGTFVKATQFRLLRLPDPDKTRAKQMNAPLRLQSRCPTMLIDDGRTSRMAGAEGWVGTTVGFGVGVGVGFGLGVGVGVGAKVGTAVGVGVSVAVGVVLACNGCPVATEPQEASSILAAMMIQGTNILFFVDTCL